VGEKVAAWALGEGQGQGLLDHPPALRLKEELLRPGFLL
jgi:hypothetical protein